MIGPGAVWAFGIPSLWELVLITVVTLVFYGRSGLPHNRYLRLLRPWSDNKPRNPAPPKSSRLGDRVYWILAITAATAVAAWIITRMLIVSAPGSSH